jgi:hypothetical protein
VKKAKPCQLFGLIYSFCYSLRISLHHSSTSVNISTAKYSKIQSSVGKCEEMGPLGRPRRKGRELLKGILKKQGVRVLIGLNWLSIGILQKQQKVFG